MQREGVPAGHSGRERSRNIQDTLTFWETEEMKRLLHICVPAPRCWGQRPGGSVTRTGLMQPFMSRRKSSSGWSFQNCPPNDQMNLPDTVLHFVSSFSYLSWTLLALLLEWRMFSMIQPHVYRTKHQNTKPRAACVNTVCSFPFWRFLPPLSFFKWMKASSFCCVLLREQKYQWNRLNTRVQGTNLNSILHIISAASHGNANEVRVRVSSWFFRKLPHMKDEVSMATGRLLMVSALVPVALVFSCVND